MADDTPEKIRKEIRNSTETLSDEINGASKGLKPKFQNMIKNIAEVNGPLAKSVAELRKTSKDTFAGALQAQKLASLTSVVDKYLTEGREAMDSNELEILRKNFMDAADGAFNITDLKKLQTQVQNSEAALNDALSAEQAAIDAKAQRLAELESGENRLSQSNARIQDLEEKQLRVKGAALTAVSKALEKEVQKRDEVQRELLVVEDKKLEQAKEARETAQATLAEEQQERDRFNDKLTEVLSESVNFEGLEQFSGQLKELTGLDLVGGLDSMTSKVLAFVGVAKTLGKGLLSAGVALKAVIMTRIVPAIAGFTASLLAGATAMIVGAIPILAIATLIGLAAFGIYKAGEYLYNESEGFREWIDETWIKIQEFGLKIKTFFTDLYNDVMELINDIEEWWSEFDLLQSIKDIWNKVKDFATETFNDIVAWFESDETSLLGTIQDAISSLMDGITGAINYVRGLLPSWLGGTPDTPEEPEMSREEKRNEERKSRLQKRADESQSTLTRLENEGGTEEQIAAARERLIFRQQQLAEVGREEPEITDGLKEEPMTREMWKNMSAADKTEYRLKKIQENEEKRTDASDRLDSPLQKGLQPVQVEAGPRLDASSEEPMTREMWKNMSAADKTEYRLKKAQENALSGNKLKQSNIEMEQAKESGRKSEMAIQNVVGGTTVNNMNTTKIMGRPNVFDDDRTVSRLNQSDW